MGSAPKSVYVPPVDENAAKAAAYVPPVAQQSPTAQSGDTAKAASAMAAGLGYGGTVLTSGQGLVQQSNGSGRGKALLGV